MLLLTSGFKSAAAQYKRRYYLAPPQSILAKQMKAKLMLCKPLFIVHARVKVLKTYTGVQKRSALARKVGVTRA